MLLWGAGGSGRGSLGSRSSSPRHPSLCAGGQVTRSQTRLLGPLRNVLEAEVGALGSASGEAPNPAPAGLLVGRTQGRELKGVGSGRAGPSQKGSTFPRPLGTG